MSELDLLVKALDEGHWELSEAFDGLPDEDVWRRPHPRLLSIGEIAGHITYWKALKLIGQEPKPDLADLPIKSPLVDEAFRYYTVNVKEPKKLELGAKEVFDEATRVHNEAKAALMQLKPDLEDKVQGFQQSTWGQILQYQVFHVAYHTGQIYSVRHLLGHETKDN